MIVVTASRAKQRLRDATAPVEVLDRARIEASGATTLDEALRAVPGLQITTSHGGAGVSMQGLDPEHTLVLIDGRPVAGRVEGTVDLARIPVDDIERVEILPGPASALYGSEALGGVLNIVTRRNTGAPRVDAAARLGSRSLAEASAAISGGAGPVAAGVSGDHNAQDGWDSDPTDAATNGDDVLDWGGRAWARWDPSGAIGVDADGAYRRRDTRGIDSTGAGAVFDIRALQETADASAGVRHWGGGASTLALRASGTLWRQQYLEDQRDSDVQDSYEETFDRRAFLNLLWSWAPARHLVVAGVDGSVEEVASDRLDEGTASRRRIAIFAQDDWRVLGRPVLSLSPGGRVDLDTQFGLHATPHLAVRFVPIDTVTLRVTAGQGYRAPEFKELYLAFNHAAYGYELHGNPALAPESSTGVTADARWTIARSAEVHAQGWWNEVANLINPTLITAGTSSTPAQYEYDNVGQAVSRGAQGGVAWVGRGPVSGNVDYTFTDTRNRDDDTPLDGRAPHRLAGTVSVRPLSPLELTGTAEWNSARPYTIEDTMWSEPYTWIDGRVAWDFAAGMTLEVGVRNALDVRDDEFLGLPPRTVYAGLRAGGKPTRKAP